MSDERLKSQAAIDHNQEMDGSETPRVIEALRLNGGVVITFADHKSAMYSAALLYAMFPNADELKEDLSGENTDDPAV